MFLTSTSMRIGIFQSNLPEEGRKVGGVEYVVHRLANQFVERRHEVVVFSHSTQAPGDALYEHRRVSRLPRVDGRLGRVTYGSAALNAIETRDVDVLNLHADDWLYLRRNVPTVRTFHGSSLREAQSATRLRRRVSMIYSFLGELLASRMATASFSVCAGMPDGYRLDGMLPQAIGLSPSASAGAEPIARTAHPTVLFVGTWHGRKRGQFLQTEFTENVLPRFPDARLIMVSDFCEETDNVSWVRFPADSELSALYSSAWVLGSASSYEGFGHPYVEAMAHGLPVLGTRNVGLEYVSGDGAAAALVEDSQLGSSLAALLGDADRRAELSRAGRAQAEHFNWDETCAAYERAFELAIERYEHRGRHRRRRR